MRCVCPRDVKKMLVQRARSVYWKKWAAKHEHEELKEGAWLEPAVALFRKKAKGVWIEKHRNVARKIFLEGGWTQKRLFDMCWSDVSQCQACHMDEGTEKHRLYHCPEWHAVRRDIRVLQDVGAKGENVEERWKWQRGKVAQPLSDSRWNRGHFSMKKWESEEHRSWGMQVEGFRGSVATDGSLLGKNGKCGACGWAAVQLDYDEEVVPLHWMYGSTAAEFEVQRTIKRAELTAFVCFLKRVSVRVQVDNKGIID